MRLRARGLRRKIHIPGIWIHVAKEMPSHSFMCLMCPANMQAHAARRPVSGNASAGSEGAFPASWEQRNLQLSKDLKELLGPDRGAIRQLKDSAAALR